LSSRNNPEGSVVGTALALLAVAGVGAFALNVHGTRDKFIDAIYPEPTVPTYNAPAPLPSPSSTAIYVQPETTLPLPAAETTLPPTPAEPITMVHIGDSIGVLKFSIGGYEQALAGNGIELLAHDEKGARPIVWGPCETDPASERCEGPAWQWDASKGIYIGAGDAIRSLSHMSEQVALADIVQLDMGQNTLEADLAHDTERMLREAWALSAADGVPATIVMANMAHTNTSYVGPASERNTIIIDVATVLRSEGMDIRIIDVASSGYELDAGGIHPTALGAQQRPNMKHPKSL
jgi:hypothetical protein